MNVKEFILKNYNITVLNEIYSNTSNKVIKIISVDKEYILKKCDKLFNEKIKYLKGLHVNNLIFPILNVNEQYVTEDNYQYWYLQEYKKNNLEINEIKAKKLLNQLKYLHQKTSFRKSLSPLKSKKKFEEIFNYLQYKFSMLETFVRDIEAKEYDEYSIVILKGYHYILDAKKYMEKLNKKIINNVKDKITVDYVFLHGNPKLNHLINYDDDYLISYQDGYYGIISFDIAKYYIEVEDLNINHYELINEYFSSFDNEFYFNYFCFLVLLYYIKSIIVYEKDYVSSQSFVYVCSAIKTFFERFKERLN